VQYVGSVKAFLIGSRSTFFENLQNYYAGNQNQDEILARIEKEIQNASTDNSNSLIHLLYSENYQNTFSWSHKYTY
jgi:hypothetical protein